MRIGERRIGQALAAAMALAATLLAPAGLRASEALPSGWAAPVAPAKPDPELFAEAVRFLQCRPAEAGPRAAGGGSGPDRGGNRPRPQHGPPPHPQPCAAGAGPTHPGRAAAPRGRHLPACRREHRPRQDLPAARPSDLDRGRGLRLPLRRHAGTGPDAYLRQPGAADGGALARLAQAPRRAALPRFQRIGSGLGVDPGGPACGDVYLVQTFAD